MAIKADTTLVQAAFKEGQTGAMADVPDMKPMFESQKEVQKTYMDTITGVMDTLKEKKEQEETAKVQGLKPVKETIQKAYNALETGEPLPGFVVDDFAKEIENLQDSFEKVNTEGKGDTRANEKKRREITARLMRLKNQAVDVRSKYAIAFQDPSSYNDPNIKGEDIDAINSIATAFSDPDAATEMFKGGNIKGGFVNGEYTIFTKGSSRVKGGFGAEGITREEYKYEKSFTGSDIVKALPYKNAANDVAVGKFLKGAAETGAFDGKSGGVNKYADPNARNTEIAEALDLIKTDEDYYDMQSRRLEGTGMTASFDQALGTLMEIPIEVAKNMFVDGDGETVTDMHTYFAELDQQGNKDGIINSADAPKDKGALEKFMNNIETTKEEILKNREIGGPMMAEWIADSKIGAYNDNYKANTPKVETKQKTPAQILSEQKFFVSQQEKLQAETDVQNTVYSIENEFSRGDTRVGTGTRYAVKTEAKEAYTDTDGNKVDATSESWALYVNDELIDEVAYDNPEALDEITKHVVRKGETGGKYETYEIGQIQNKKEGYTGPATYKGRGKWSVTLTKKEIEKGYEVSGDGKRIFMKLKESDKRYIKGKKERIEITKR